MNSSGSESHVIFGTGPIGLALMNELVSHGKQVRLVNRGGALSQALPPGVELARGDAADPEAAKALCQGAAVVYNCANPAYTEWPKKFPPLQAGVLAGAAAAGAKLVAMENVYMYGPTGGKPLTEDLPYAAATRKGQVRAHMAEELFAAHAAGRLRVSIGRASDYFGPGAIQSSAGERMFAPALAGKTVQVLGNPDLPHTYSYVLDIARGLAILGERDEALGQAWHLPSAPTITTRQFVEQICRMNGQKPHIQAAPRLLIQVLGLFDSMMHEVAEMVYEFEEPFILDDSRFVKAFGNIATPLPEAIECTAQWFLNRKA
ncbi:MAG: NAD-dependent epimerase/dehydratase family protein [Anaerolineaceae bacterium]|nr:NAD-dependent epimerase/dehydratase family protein [Anaerolineaceae bacterium]